MIIRIYQNYTVGNDYEGRAEGNFEDDIVNESKYEDGPEYTKTAGTPRKTTTSKSRNPAFLKSDLSSIDIDGDGKVSIEN